MNRPEFIYFDLGNVILNFSHERAIVQMAEVSGVAVRTIRETVFHSDLQKRYERGDIDSCAFFEYFCDRTRSSPDRDHLLLAASDIFWLNDEVADLVQSLAGSETVRIGLLSNTCDAHWEFIKHAFPICHQMEVFESTVLSFEHNCVKPEAEIYRRAAEEAQVPLSSIFFIDDLHDNIEGARAEGMDAILFRDAEQLVSELAAREINV